jgi:hypothetical protein
VGKVPLSKWLAKRPVRTRMRGVVGRAGEKPALTRLDEAAIAEKRAGFVAKLSVPHLPLFSEQGNL